VITGAQRCASGHGVGLHRGLGRRRRRESRRPREAGTNLLQARRRFIQTSTVSFGSNAKASRLPLQAMADPVEASVMAATQKASERQSFTDKSGPAAWKHLPSWYLIFRQRSDDPTKAEEFMARRMGATIRTAHASHTSMVSHPKEVVEIILLAAKAQVAGHARELIPQRF